MHIMVTRCRNIQELSIDYMKKRPLQPSSLKYPVLKPNPILASLRHRLGPFQSDCGFQVGQEGESAVRCYQVALQSIERFVQACQWRFEQTAPIVRCLYVDLLTPRPSSRTAVQVFVEHLELPLSQMKGLISPEGLYLARQSLEGFRVLWEKTGEVGVSEEAIGLDPQGRCRVWMNRSLALNQPSQPVCSKPGQIAIAVLRMVQARSEPVAYALLAKMIDRICSKQMQFEAVETALGKLAQKFEINIPDHLKYLVYQHRLRIKVKILPNGARGRDLGRGGRRPSFLPRKQNVYGFLTDYEGEEKGRKVPHRHTSALQAGTQTPLLALGHLPSVYSSVPTQDLNSSVIQMSNRPRLSNNLGISISIRSKESISPVRTESLSMESIRFLGALTPKNEGQGWKRVSNCSDNTKTKVSIMSRSKTSNCSLLDAATSKRLTAKCSYLETPSQELADLHSQSESDSGESKPSAKILEQPTTPKLPMEQQPQGATFQKIPQAEEIFLANRWTATLRNLAEHDTKLNTSIIYGQDNNVYLADVKLEALDGLVGGLASSVSSREEEVK